jgi:hypothetical protein
VADGDDHGLDVIPGSEHPPDHVAVEHKVGRVAAPAAWGLVAPHERRFADSDAGQTSQNAEMARESEPSGMREPLPVTDKYVRRGAELLERGDVRDVWGESGRAGERVGKGGWAACAC